MLADRQHRWIAVDAMGSDQRPRPEVLGAIMAARAGHHVRLFGHAAQLQAMLAPELRSENSREFVSSIEIVDAEQAIDMDDHPARAYREKPKSSMRVAVSQVATGEASAVVSAGNTGALLATSLFTLGRVSGVERPAIIVTLPTRGGPLVLADAGANVDPKPAMLAQFAKLAVTYCRHVLGTSCPRIGLLSNGAEAAKGTDLTRAAYELLVHNPSLQAQFVGYVEGSDLFRGVIDVVITDGFVGNVVLKTCEGIAESLFGLIAAELQAPAKQATRGNALRSRVGAALVAPALQAVANRTHFSQVGGALLAGVDGVVVSAHGRSDAVAIANAISAAAQFSQLELVEKFKSIG